MQDRLLEKRRLRLEWKWILKMFMVQFMRTRHCLSRFLKLPEILITWRYIYLLKKQNPVLTIDDEYISPGTVRPMVGSVAGNSHTAVDIDFVLLNKTGSSNSVPIHWDAI